MRNIYKLPSSVVLFGFLPVDMLKLCMNILIRDLHCGGERLFTLQYMQLTT